MWRLCPKGHVSWRDTQSGSWFIEALDQVLAKYAHLEDLTSILMKVPSCPPPHSLPALRAVGSRNPSSFFGF